MQEITSMTALQLAEKVKKREVSVPEVVRAQLETIYKREPIYNAFITVMEKEAMAQAEMVQKRLDEGDLYDSPLAGVTIAVKDNICTQGVRTTCASKMLENFVPAYDATVVEKLKKAGVIIIGKTNMDEFAMGDTTKTSFFGTTKNPWNTGYVPGGSSGGSAAAVAAEEAHISLGSDTGGSIRQPASYCGVVGFKPSYGTVSRYGLIPLASSMDQIGPIGRNISDCAALLEVISGKDKRDSTSVNQVSFSYREALVDDVKGMKIGIPRLYLEEDMDKDICRNYNDAVNIFKDLGADIEIFNADAINYSLQTYNVICCAEAFSNLSRFDGVRYGNRALEYDNMEELYKRSRGEGFGYEVKRRIMLGAFVLGKDNYEAYYSKARKIRNIICKAYKRIFERYDIILCPVTTIIAPPLRMKDAASFKKSSSMTINSSANLAGLPAASIPCGKDKNGLPVGVQLVGRRFGEKNIIRAAYAFEQARPYERPENLKA